MKKVDLEGKLQVTLLPAYISWKKIMLAHFQASSEEVIVMYSEKMKTPATLLKKTSTQVLSCEICKLFKNNYFEEHLWTSTSQLYLKRDSNIGVFLWILWIIQEHLFCRGSTNGWLWTPVRGSLFSKAASLTAWRPLTVFERDCSIGISLWSF